jgi:hypothetical protein
MKNDIKNFIPRNIEDKTLSWLLDKSSALFDECNDYGVGLTIQYFKTKCTCDEDLPPLLFFRSFLEVSDSFSILFKNSCIEACKILLRSMLESYFNLEYLLNSDTKRKALAYLIWDTHDQIDLMKKLDPDLDQGRNFINQLRKDKFLKDIDLPVINSKMESTIQNEFLTLPKCIEIESIYQDKRKQLKDSKQNTHLEWYSILSNIKTVEDLASQSSLSGLYSSFYKRWSLSTHAKDITRGKLMAEKDGSIGLVQLRSPEEAKHVFSSAYFLIAKELTLFSSVYFKEIQKSFDEWINERNKEFHKLK